MRALLALPLAVSLPLFAACQGSAPQSTRAPTADAHVDGFPAKCEGLGMTPAECADLASSVLPLTLPPALGNDHGDDENAAELGFDLFFDLAALTPSEKRVRCATCHAPERAFSNNQPLPIGVTLGLRNALPLVNAARQYPHFWDGRADTLWTQSLFTIENADEMNGTRLAVAHTMAGPYRDRYEKAFGPIADISDLARFPASGKPGQPAWDGMADTDKTTVNRIYSNVGKSFEAYVRKIAAGRSAVDRFILGDFTALNEKAQRGMASFVKYGCRSCHTGVNYSDGTYHGLDLPPPTYSKARDKVKDDRGRPQGLEQLLASDFNSKSQYFDRTPGEEPKFEEDMRPFAEKTFLTPSLRNVGDTAPYSHTGVFTSLSTIVRFIIEGGGPACKELVRQDVTADTVDDIVEFLNGLHGDTAPLPWSFWPKLGTGKPYDAGVPPSPDASVRDAAP